MKRTIKRADGSEETQEGTPDELASLDKLQREEEARRFREACEPRKKPDTLLPEDPKVTWLPDLSEGCLFSGLPAGSYLLSCPCPLHSVHC